MIREQTQWECVGCGFCCVESICTYGRQKHHKKLGRICPELHWSGSRYLCRLMLADNRLADFYKESLHTGKGCRAFTNPWRGDVRERAAHDVAATFGDDEPR